MEDSYWTKVLSGRVSRRRALAGTAGVTGAAAFLAACGSDDDGGSGGSGGTGATGGSGLVAKLEKAPSKAGGVMKWQQASEPLHFDGQAQGQAQLNIYNGMAYEALVRNKMGEGQASSVSEVEPNLAQSWEFSPDKTTLTFKLRPGVKFHNVAPVNGRVLDAQDVAQSWTRYVGQARNNKAANANSVNPTAPIISVTATDNSTVVVKLNAPTSFIMQRFANMITGEIGGIYPREADNGFDPAKGQIGTGAYMLDRHTPSVGLVYKKHPEYWNKEAGFPESMEVPFLNEPAARLAQLKTGAIYAMGGLADISPEDVVPTKKDVPALNLYQFIAPNNNVSFIQRMGWKPLNGQKSPFVDVRVRQAMALAIDRDSYIDAFSNISKYEAEGLPAEPLYHTSMGFIPGVTLDPRSKDFGENAKNYTYDLPEAKKLMAAAGFASGFEYPSAWPNFPAFGPNFPRQIEVMDSFNRELGLKPQSVPLDYNIDYLPKYVTMRGQHEGIAFTLGAVTSADPVDYFVWRYYSKSGATSGAIFGDIGSGDGAGDPKVDDFIDKAKAELDAGKQRTILSDLQKYLGGMQYAVTSPGLGTQYTLAWPAVRGYLYYQGDSRAINSFYYTWSIDDTQAPLKRA